MKNKRFNITGACFPDEHYMVDISERLEKIRSMIIQGDYFIINSGRQYGKTTTLNALENYLSSEYLVISMDLQFFSAADLDSESGFVLAFAREMYRNSIFRTSLNNEIKDTLKNMKTTGQDHVLADLFDVFCEICDGSEKPVVLMIDEIDNAAGTDIFIDFLSMIRGYYLRRNRLSFFRSVILAGVRDIRNLKSRIRSDADHQHNSPWNIAIDFNIDMSLSTGGIEGMLSEYKTDHESDMDTRTLANLIYDYTSGYPVLVSHICKLIDEEIHSWDESGVIAAVNRILSVNDPLFESLNNKLEDYPEVKSSLYNILIRGDTIPYNPDNEAANLLVRFGFVRVVDNTIVIANRIFETRLYNDMLTSSEVRETPISKAGFFDKPVFVKNGMLDVELIFERFIQHFHDIYGNEPEKFIEEDGRKCFLMYLRPIINGVGNYYIEAHTRDNRRMDIVIDYLGKRYVIELKIWRGQKYNEKGEKQILGYLETWHMKKGYMLTFSFSKNKETGIKTVEYGDKTIVEAIV